MQLRDPAATLGQIDANRGCPMSATSVTVGVNKATGNGSAAQQKLTTAGGGGPAGCQSAGQHAGRDRRQPGVGPRVVRRSDDRCDRAERSLGDNDLHAW